MGGQASACLGRPAADESLVQAGGRSGVPSTGKGAQACIPSKAESSGLGSLSLVSAEVGHGRDAVPTNKGEAAGAAVEAAGVVAAPKCAGGPALLAGHFATTDPLKVAPELAPTQGLPYQVHMCGPPPPPCNDGRLQTVKALRSVNPNIMDPSSLEAPPDPEIASILKLVASIFNAPAALVALFDDRRIFIRDSEGAFARGDFPWRWSFCGWTMSSKLDQIMVIPDATKDYRFSENQFVKDGTVRFYCGTPLIASNSHRLGTLCFADNKPREFDAGSCMILNNLAELVVRQIEKDIALQLRKHDNETLCAAYGHMRRTLDCFEHCVALVDTGTPGWKMLYVNTPCLKLLGLDRDVTQSSPVCDLLESFDGCRLPWKELQEASDTGRDFSAKARLVAGVTADRELAARRFMLRFRPASREDLGDGQLPIGIPSFIPMQAAHPGGGGPTVDHLYFMILEDLDKMEQRQAAEAREKVAAAEAAAAAAKEQMIKNTTSSTALLLSSGSLALPPDSIEGLIMGHLLGKGAYGSVYYGTWFGTPVAVKIIDEQLAQGTAAQAAHSEAALTQELRHPHIVATLRCATRTIQLRGGSSCQTGWLGSGGRGSGSVVGGGRSSSGGVAGRASQLRHRLQGAPPAAGSGSKGAKLGCGVADTPTRNSAGGDSDACAFSDDTARAPSSRASLQAAGSSTSGNDTHAAGSNSASSLSRDQRSAAQAAPGSAVAASPFSARVPAMSMDEVTAACLGSSAGAQYMRMSEVDRLQARQMPSAVTVVGGCSMASVPEVPLSAQAAANGLRSSATQGQGWAIIQLGAGRQVVEEEGTGGTNSRENGSGGAPRDQEPPVAAVPPPSSAPLPTLPGVGTPHDVLPRIVPTLPPPGGQYGWAASIKEGEDSGVSPFLVAGADSFNVPPSSEVLGSLVPGQPPRGPLDFNHPRRGNHDPCGGQAEECWNNAEGGAQHQTWLVMEYCDKGCLQDAVDRGWLRNSPSCLTSVPRMDAVLATAMEMASALAFLHARDVVHGDLSAWNVMLCSAGTSVNEGSRGFVAKIADFGLARHLDVRTRVLTRTYGTLTHMPAETLRDGVISKAVDVYSFGVLLWQMYTGSRPWAGLRHGQIIVMVVTQGARLRFPEGTLPAYEELANACMEQDAAKRPTFEQIMRSLEAMKQELGA